MIRSPLNYGGLVLKKRILFAPASMGLPRQELVARLPDLPIDYKPAVRQENPHYGNAGVAESELPVCGVGGLTDPDFIETQLQAGRIDCAAMSRQLIADPNWPSNGFAGKTGEIRRCIRCNKACLGGMLAHRGVYCIDRKETIL